MFDRRRRLDEEVDAHLAEETADNIARGMNPTAARQAALRTFGNVEAAKERLRELHPLYWLDTLWQDVRFAARLIVRDRWISATIVATLTVGIAINVSAFSLLNAALLRAWVRADPETFISVIPRFAGRYGLRYSDYASMSQPDYVRLRDSARSLDSLAAYRKVSLTLSGAEAGSIRAALVSCNLSDVIRQEPPVAGRYLRPDECALGSPAAVAVLSEAAWRGRFASDPDVIGRVFHLNRVPFTVVGVAPSLGLPGLDGASEVWMPYTLLGQVRPADDYFADPRAQWLTVLGRRQPGVSLRQVEEELRLIARAADEDVPGRRTALLVTDGSLISDPEMRARAPIIFALTLGTATILLLLACVNVTTLLLSRSAARQREIAVRVSLGAGRFRLLRQLLTEGVVLSAIAAAVSLLIAWRGPAALWSAVASSPPPFDITPDWRVLLYCLVMALAAGIVAGLSPSLESLRPRLSESLKGSSGVVTAGRRRSRLRSLLVVAQIALSLVLLIQVALLTKAQRRFFSYDPGFETDAVLNVTLGSVLSGFAPPSSFYQELESRIRALPGVARTSYASLAPWSGRNPTLVLEVDGRPLPGARDYSQAPARRVVSPDYFATLNIPVTRGRALTRDDVAAAPQPVPAVISEAMARRYWPGQDPVGHRFRTSVVHEVVGVSRDVQSVTYMQDDGPFYYSPLDAREPAPAYMLVRVSGDTQAVGAAVARIVRQVDPDMAATVVTLASIVEREGERLEPVTRYGAAAGLLALLLALSGVYAVVSFSVSQRTREIGIRTALGARRQDVLALVLRSAVTQVVWGLAAGIGLALAVSTGMESVFFGVSPRDPATVVLVSVLLSLAALGAIWIPARRAASLDPLSSLRYD